MTASDEPIDDERVLALIEIHRHPSGKPNETAIAKALGRSPNGIKRAIQRLAREGRLGTRPVLPGFAIKQVSEQQNADGETQKTWIKQAPLGEAFEVPEGHSVKGVSALVDAQGQTLQQWIKTKAEPAPEDTVDAIKKAFENYAPAAPPTPLSDLPYQDCLTLYPLPDLHVGMFSWSKETDVDWDLKIAEQTIIATIESIHLRTAPSEVGIVLVGGDVVHSDTRSNTTERSGNVLQVDGRYDKVIEVTQRIIVRAVELALHKHRRTIVRVLKGNHDYHTSVAVAHFLRAWYRNEPRVEVDISPSLFWFHTFGQNFLAAHHGHETTAEQMPMKMASARPEMWGSSRHRYVHIFHWHRSQKTRDTIGGVIVEKHEAPVPKDDWNYGKSHLSGRSLCSIAYDPERGESGRVTENL